MTTWLLHGLARSLLLAGAMFWTVLWALVLGFTRSAIVRVLLSREQTERHFGAQGWREVALATVWGAGSFSTSYAAVAMARTLFRKHGSLLSALVFLFASTNLSSEFLLVLWLLLGWRVLLLELGGGLVFIAVLSLIVRATWRPAWDQRTRDHQDEMQERAGEKSWAEAEGETLREKILSRRNWATVADGFARDWRRTGRPLILGFVLAGCLAVFVPRRWWEALQIARHPAGAQTLENALVGPLVAVVCGLTSLANLPLARLLYSDGLSLSGMLSFLFADLAALPLALMYREHFGAKTAVYVVAVLLVSAVIAGAVVGLGVQAAHLSPRLTAPPGLLAQTSGGWRSPTLMNAAAILLTGALLALRHRYGRQREPA